MAALLANEPGPPQPHLDALDHALAVLECHPDYPTQPTLQLGVQLATAELVLLRWSADAPPPTAEHAVTAATECLPAAIHAAAEVAPWVEAYAHYCGLDSHQRAALDDQWRRAEQPRLLDELDARQLRRSRVAPRTWGPSPPGSPPDNPRRRRDSVFLPVSVLDAETNAQRQEAYTEEPTARAQRALAHMAASRQEVGGDDGMCGCVDACACVSSNMHAQAGAQDVLPARDTAEPTVEAAVEAAAAEVHPRVHEGAPLVCDAAPRGHQGHDAAGLVDRTLQSVPPPHASSVGAVEAAVEAAGAAAQPVPEEDVAAWAAQAGAALLLAERQETRQGLAAGDDADSRGGLAQQAVSAEGPSSVVGPSSVAPSSAAGPPQSMAPPREASEAHASSPPTLRAARAPADASGDLETLFGRWRLRGAATTRRPSDGPGTTQRDDPAHQAGPRYVARARVGSVSRGVPRGHIAEGSGDESEQRMLSCSTLLAAAAAYEVMDSHRARARGTLASQRAALHQRQNDEGEGGRRERNPFWQVQ